MPLSVGDLAPDFSYTDVDGTARRLSGLRGNKHAVVYFYPADFTTVCTRETCGFRDAHGELASADTEIIGISVDNEAKHAEFAAAHQVPFPLVTDADLSIAKQYKATSFVTNLLKKTARVTYVIDKKGVVRGVFEGMFSASHHVDSVRALIRSGL